MDASCADLEPSRVRDPLIWDPVSWDLRNLYTAVSGCSADLCLHAFKYIKLIVIAGGSEIRPGEI